MSRNILRIAKGKTKERYIVLRNVSYIACLKMHALCTTVCLVQ